MVLQKLGALIKVSLVCQKGLTPPKVVKKFLSAINSPVISGIEKK